MVGHLAPAREGLPPASPLPINLHPPTPTTSSPTVDDTPTQSHFLSSSSSLTSRPLGPETPPLRSASAATPSSASGTPTSGRGSSRIRALSSPVPRAALAALSLPATTDATSKTATSSLTSSPVRVLFGPSSRLRRTPGTSSAGISLPPSPSQVRAIGSFALPGVIRDANSAQADKNGSQIPAMPSDHSPPVKTSSRASPPTHISIPHPSQSLLSTPLSAPVQHGNMSASMTSISSLAAAVAQQRPLTATPSASTGARLGARESADRSVSANVGPGTGPERKPSSLWGPVATQANASETVEPGRLGELKRFTLWETRTRFYMVAFNTSQTRFRILKVDRTPPIAATSNAQASQPSWEKDRDARDTATASAVTSAAAQSLAASGLATPSLQVPSVMREREGEKTGRSKNPHGTENGQNNDPSVSASGEKYMSMDSTEPPRLRKVTDSKQPLTGANGETADSARAGSTMNGPASTLLPNGRGDKKGPPRVNADNQTEGSEWELHVTSDRVVYTRTQVAELLDMIREGNRASGGLREIGRFFGIVGFIRFTGTYYMVLISRRSVVALIGGHYIYHCDETKVVPVCHPAVMATLGGRSKALEQEEARLLHTFRQVDLSKNFYFSYTYDLTKTLQDNLTDPPASPPKPGGSQREERKGRQEAPTTAWGYNEKFVWNHHLLLPAFGASEHADNVADEYGSGNEWVLPLVYGFVDQAKLSVLNRTIYVTLIARRSRHFAGARYLKRGVNEKGQVANDVETEQIVSEALTTPFYAPAPRRYPRYVRKRAHSTMAGDEQDRVRDREEEGEEEEGGQYRMGPSPRFTSYVMHRGSIPIYWTQDTTNMSPRPPIEISVVDPYYSAAALHFDDLFRRYGTPVIVLNLIKSKEKQPREMKLLRAFGECVSYLNQFLPEGKKTHYIAWDMSRASKSHDQDVIGVLEDIAEETVEATRFFHSGPEPQSFRFQEDEDAGRRETILLQNGVARVNCVDCLDRTNAAQFVIGKAAFGHQLHALGLLDNPTLPFDSDAVNMLTEMYHDLGDTIALQYGGSHLVNTMETYRKINQWTSHSRDMLEGLKRYYANSFVDADKQAAINLFLGIDVDAPDFAPPQDGSRPHYRHWYTPAHLEPRGTLAARRKRLIEVVNADTGFWAEYYRPSLFTDLERHHAFKMTAVHQLSHPQHHLQSQSHPHPHPHGHPYPNATGSGYGYGLGPGPDSGFGSGHTNTLVEFSPFKARTTASQAEPPVLPPRALIGGVRRWMSLNRPLGPGQRKKSKKYVAGGAEEGVGGEEGGDGLLGLGSGEKKDGNQMVPTDAYTANFEALVANLISPSVNAEEAAEYDWYTVQFRDAPLGHQSHQIAETDAALYEDGARLAAGEREKVAPLFPTMTTMTTTTGGTTGMTTTEESPDPAFVAYAAATTPGAVTLEKTANEKKSRAYATWLQMGQVRL